uniref:tRNA (guanine-N(7)-)-methyltransferase n=1 Tax=Candidatus Kentrum sp. DK TaxID=2126562 RepID=A0A450SFX4_9GAMM|nr:MAG: tRNA (guanine-N(7)-)-methyltransferase [Candidatus Kentron sp. DK]VFJ51827.1 MAG: tRNA (guanine-N(7)-)-methyltransferase [Candidatus Kentron sp. DK]
MAKDVRNVGYSFRVSNNATDRADPVPFPRFAGRNGTRPDPARVSALADRGERVIELHGEQTQRGPETRRIRSFVCRPGRITDAQRRALAIHWARFGVETQGPLDPVKVFGRRGPLYLEIGFGMGDALMEMALADPEGNYLGAEVYEPGIGRLLNNLNARDIGNARVMRGDAVEILARCIPQDSLDGVFVYFPDPWPKKRHHKRRLVQPDFVSLVCSRLRPGGRFELATDWADYAEHMLRALEAAPDPVNTAGPGNFSPRPSHRPVTKFERRGQGKGYGIWDLVFRRRET